MGMDPEGQDTQKVDENQVNEAQKMFEDCI